MAFAYMDHRFCAFNW